MSARWESACPLSRTIDQRNRPAYFRDGERIDLEATWEGPGHRFDGASAEPIIVRTHGRRRG